MYPELFKRGNVIPPLFITFRAHCPVHYIIILTVIPYIHTRK